MKAIKRNCPPALLPLQNIPRDPCPSGTYAKMSQWVLFTCNPGSFQTAVTVLGLRVRVFMCPLRAECWFPNTLAELDISPADLQSQIWGFMSVVQVLWTGEPHVELGLLVPWGRPLRDSPPAWGCGSSVDCVTAYRSSCPSWCGFFSKSFVVVKSL